ncbi:MAG: substrate-binding domain-containing protein [Sedimentisphaeraceae bacterium JB056]
MKNLTGKQKNVVEAVARFVSVNGLTQGDKLPPIREMSKDTGFAHVTVAEAYKKLAEYGYVESKGKRGTCISDKFTAKVIESNKQLYILNLCDISDYSIREAHSPFSVELREGVRNHNPNIDVVSIVFDSNTDGVDGLRCIADYHYWSRPKRDNIVFALSHCPAWVKSFFADNDIPAIVVGGVDEEVSLPRVSADTDDMFDTLMYSIDQSQSWPMVFIVKPGVFGDHAYFRDRLNKLDELKYPRLVSGNTFTVSQQNDVAIQQITQMLMAPRRPKTLLVQGEDIASEIIVICDNIGLQIPRDLRIVVMQTSFLGSFIRPTLTGFYPNLSVFGEKIAEFVEDICYSDKPEKKVAFVKTMLVFRESFPQSFTNWAEAKNEK